MIRYKYGPWDDRYYAVIGALVSRGLLRYVRRPTRQRRARPDPDRAGVRRAAGGSRRVERNRGAQQGHSGVIGRADR